LIQVSHLTKVYGSHKAVDDLSFTIESGKVYGFLGPNGAGKSTTMNIITGCLAATSGEVIVGGHDIFEEPIEAKRLIGYLPELPPLYGDMTPDEFLRFVGKARGLRGKELRDMLREVTGLTALGDVRRRLIKNLSKGYRQRVGIAMALIGKPEVIILDEPTVGLDPKQIIEIRGLIKSLAESHTVILSSHILSEIREVCDEIIIISHGRLVANDTYENLTRRLASGREIILSTRAECADLLRGIDGVISAELTKTDDSLFTYTVAEDEGKTSVPESIAFALAENRIGLHEMTPVRASLEDVFLELTGSGDEETEEEVNAPETASEGSVEQ